MSYRHILMTAHPLCSSSFVRRSFHFESKRFTGENKRDKLTNTCGMRVSGGRGGCFKLAVLVYTMPGIWVIAGGRGPILASFENKRGHFRTNVKILFCYTGGGGGCTEPTEVLGVHRVRHIPIMRYLDSLHTSEK